MDWLKNKRIAFHIHTKYSNDSLIKPETIVDQLISNNIDLAIITDHNSIEGAIKAKEYALQKYKDRFEVVIGEEISTEIGDIIAFPLKSLINSSDINQLFLEAKSQNAFLCLPHPYEFHNLFEIHTLDFIKNIDFVEIINSRTSEIKNNYAKEYAFYFKKNILVGVDAHIKNELLNNYNYFDKDFKNEFVVKGSSFKRNIRKSQMIKYWKELNVFKLFKYIFLYILNL